MNMVRVFITGSSDGIGQAAGKLLADQGHQVTLHARNANRAATAHAAVPNAQGVLIGDLTSIAETKQLARDANAAGPFDAVVHNAAIGYGSTATGAMTPDGISAVFAVNTLAPYILTCLMDRPTSRLMFMSSDSHYEGDEGRATKQSAATSPSYEDSKLHDVMLANAFARRWGDIQVVSMHPGWVRTKMGGMGAPEAVDGPARALASWAAGEGPLARLRSGAFMTTSGEEEAHPGAGDVARQEELLRLCKGISGCSVPDEE